MDEDRLVRGWLVVAAILLPATLLLFLLGYWLGAIFATGVLLHALLFYLRVLRQGMLLERQGLAREFLSAMDTTLRPVGELAAGVLAAVPAYLIFPNAFGVIAGAVILGGSLLAALASWRQNTSKRHGG